MSFRFARWRKNMAKIKVKIKIYGLVQGVFFRTSVQQKAKELGVSLPKREGMPNPTNMSDGTVEIILEGEEYAVSYVTEWCKTGPSLSNVKKIEVTRL